MLSSMQSTFNIDNEDGVRFPLKLYSLTQNGMLSSIQSTFNVDYEDGVLFPMK